MTREEFGKNYWENYLKLEIDFLCTLEFVAFSEDYFSVYSNQYASCLRELGSATDVIMKEVSGIPLNDKKNIADYAKEIFKKYPNITEQEVTAKDITIKPFENWDKSKPAQSLGWWNAYNNVKHEGNAKIEEATMKNVLYALGALYILNLYLLKEIADKNDGIDAMEVESQFLTLVGRKQRFAFRNNGQELVEIYE